MCLFVLEWNLVHFHIFTKVADGNVRTLALNALVGVNEKVFGAIDHAGLDKYCKTRFGVL